MAVLTVEKSHSLKLGEYRIDIYPEHKRLYKFVSWKNSSPLIKKYLIERLKLLNPNVSALDGFDLRLESVNPMRRSRFGNFYLDIKGDVLDLNGEIIATFSDLNFTNVPVSEGYITHDSKEIEDRKQIEVTFGKDQYSKEFSIQVQALEEVLFNNQGSITLSLDKPKEVEEFVKTCMELTGWTAKEDNRIHSRVKRLPPYMEVPE